MFRVPVERIRRVAAVCGFDFCGPGCVFGVVVGRVAAGVVWVLRGGLVGHYALAEELVHVVAGYSGGDDEEDAGRSGLADVPSIV